MAAGTPATCNTNVQTGDFDVLGLNNRALVNFQDTGSDGYLTYQTPSRQNYLVKTQTELAPGWTLTALANYNGLFQHRERQQRRHPGPDRRLWQAITRCRPPIRNLATYQRL